jgi:hypothetical protein
MAKRKKGAKRGSEDVVVIDFSQMEESEGGGKRYKEGDYVGKILSAKRDVSSEKGSPCIKIVLQFLDGRYKGKKITERLWLSNKALPRIADLLEILGVKVPKREVGIPLKKLVGKEIGFSLEDEEYDDKMRSRVSWDFLDPDDVREDDDEDEDDDDDDELDLDDEDEDDEDDDDDDDDDEDDEDEVDLSDMDRSELKAYIKENDLDVKVTKKTKDAKIRKLIEAAEEADDEDDDDDDDDELESLDLDDL